MKLVFDSNIFVSSLDPNDVFHAECYPLFEKLVNFEIEAVCPALVIAETTCVLQRRTGNEVLARRIFKNLALLPAINWLDITLAVAERACLLGTATGLKGGDAIVLQVAEQYGIPLVTKDGEIKDKAPKGILTFEPKDIPI